MEPDESNSFEDLFVKEVFLSGNFSKKAIGKALAIATRSNVPIDNMNDLRDEFDSYVKSEVCTVVSKICFGNLFNNIVFPKICIDFFYCGQKFLSSGDFF